MTQTKSNEVVGEVKENGPRIYVASLADYNAGRLHGRWIDADQSAVAVREAISLMLAQSKEPIAEDWAIHDYEGFFDLRLSEFEDIDRVAEAATLLTVHGAVFAGLLSHFGGVQNIDEARQYMTEGYHGAFRNLEEYAAEFIEDCYSDALKQIPEWLRYHIDYEGVARDWELSGDIFTVECDGMVHVFSGNI